MKKKRKSNRSIATDIINNDFTYLNDFNDVAFDNLIDAFAFNGNNPPAHLPVPNSLNGEFGSNVQPYNIGLAIADPILYDRNNTDPANVSNINTQDTAYSYLLKINKRSTFVAPFKEFRTYVLARESRDESIRACAVIILAFCNNYLRVQKNLSAKQVYMMYSKLVQTYLSIPFRTYNNEFVLEADHGVPLSLFFNYIDIVYVKGLSFESYNQKRIGRLNARLAYFQNLDSTFEKLFVDHEFNYKSSRPINSYVKANMVENSMRNLDIIYYQEAAIAEYDSLNAYDNFYVYLTTYKLFDNISYTGPSHSKMKVVMNMRQTTHIEYRDEAFHDPDVDINVSRNSNDITAYNDETGEVVIATQALPWGTPDIG